MLGVLVFGIGSYNLLPVAALPNVDFPTITVTANYPGANPGTVASATSTSRGGGAGTLSAGASGSVLARAREHPDISNTPTDKHKNAQAEDLRLRNRAFVHSGIASPLRLR